MRKDLGYWRIIAELWPGWRSVFLRWACLPARIVRSCCQESLLELRSRLPLSLCVFAIARSESDVSSERKLRTRSLVRPKVGRDLTQQNQRLPAGHVIGVTRRMVLPIGPLGGDPAKTRGVANKGEQLPFSTRDTN